MNQNQPWEPSVVPLPFNLAKTWKVVASAGTGKTYTVEKCIFELIESGVKPGEIMYLIYNKIPATEFQNKMLARGIDKKDMRWIGTHHSICLKMLGLSGKNVLNLKKWGEENGMDCSEDSQICSILETLEKKTYEGKSDFDPLETKLLNMLYVEESKEKWTHARYMSHALISKRIPADVKYVFVDEAQDGNKIQWDYYEFLKGLDQIKGLMLVGDDKQSLSEWCGGRGDMFLAFEGDRQVCLGKTYRNSKAILDEANYIAGKISERSPLTTETAQIAPGSVSKISYFHNCTSELIEALRKKEKVMVLCRVGIFVNMAKKIMQENNIPVDSQTRHDVIDTVKAMKRMASKSLQNVTLHDILQIFSYDKLKTKGYCDNMARFKRGEFEDTALAEYTLMECGEVWSGDLSLFGFTPQFEADLKATLDGKLPRGAWAGVTDAMIYEVEQSMRLFGDDHGAVVCKTIHSIKGLECDTVFLIKNIVTVIRNNEHSNSDAELKCWYVAVTRAKLKLVITEIFTDRRMVTRLI